MTKRKAALLPTTLLQVQGALDANCGESSRLRRQGQAESRGLIQLQILRVHRMGCYALDYRDGKLFAQGPSPATERSH